MKNRTIRRPVAAIAGTGTAALVVQASSVPDAAADSSVAAPVVEPPVEAGATLIASGGQPLIISSSGVPPVVEPPVEPAATPIEPAIPPNVDDADEPVEGRVIVAFDDYAPNAIFVGTGEEAAALEGEGKIDCHPAAVAYAKSLVEG